MRASRAPSAAWPNPRQALVTKAATLNSSSNADHFATDAMRRHQIFTEIAFRSAHLRRESVVGRYLFTLHASPAVVAVSWPKMLCWHNLPFWM